MAKLFSKTYKNGVFAKNKFGWIDSISNDFIN